MIGFRPRVLDTLPGCGRASFTHDLLAGITVGVLALPLAMAFAIALLGTFFVTVVFDLTLAVELGLVLASLFFIYRMSDLTRVQRIALDEYGRAASPVRADGTPRVQACRVFGALFFGAANKLEHLMLLQDGHPEVLILDMEKVISIDTTGLDALQTLHRTLQKRGVELILCDLNDSPASLISRSGFAASLGTANIVPALTEALARAQRMRSHDPEVSYA